MTVMNKISTLKNLVKNNFIRKFNPHKGIREKISNWLYVYLEYSSFLLDLIEIRYPSLLRTFNSKIIYKNGTIINKPVLYRYCSGFSANEVYFQQFFNAFGETIKFNEGDIIIDAGSHVGTFSVPLALNEEKIRVIAIEANPENVKLLKKNILDNNLKNIEVLNGALSDLSGEITFNFGGSSTTGFLNDIAFFMSTNDNNKATVPSYTILDLFQNFSIEKCKILKMDIEGAEYIVLSKQTWIFDITDILMMELHEVDGKLPMDTALMKEIKQKFDISISYPSLKKGNKVIEVVGKIKSNPKKSVSTSQ